MCKALSQVGVGEAVSCRLVFYPAPKPAPEGGVGYRMWLKLFVKVAFARAHLRRVCAFAASGRGNFGQRPFELTLAGGERGQLFVNPVNPLILKILIQTKWANAIRPYGRLPM